MKRFTILCAAFLLLAPLPAAAGIQLDRKTRKQLEKENVQLRQRLEEIQQELESLKTDAQERDSLQKQLDGTGSGDRIQEAAGMGAAVDYFDSPLYGGGDYVEDQQSGFDYTDDVTDSLLSIWYLHRQIRENPQSEYNMDSVHFSSEVPDRVLIERLEKMNSFIQLPYNETVKNYMVLYSEKMPTRMGQILGLAQYYMPIFEEAFRKYGLPLELKYMAIIESALNPLAVSRVGATGMWQFMHSTARNYGLRIDSFIDDRMDPVASVDAAARYLRDAYRIFGDWSLAISSYNCGSGNVNKAIKRAGRRDFWSIYPHLPRETRGYVPAMVGAMYAVNYAKEYGLEPAPVQMPAHIDTFMINKNLHFRQISEVIGVPIDDLRDLNPQYYKDIVPGNQGEQILRIPFNYSNAFLDSQDTIYKYKAAEMFSGSVDVGRPQSATSTRSAAARSGGGEWVYYKVRRGDNLGKIAARNHTTVKNIKSWNGLKSDRIREGQRLKVGRR